jgi:peptidoglycan hydrolase-like protein with peptidoglycan-binding domain
MHPIVLLILGGTGFYFLWDSLEEAPETQSLDNPAAGTSIVVPTSSDKPSLGVSDVPIPPGNGTAAVHIPHKHKHKRTLDSKTPAVVTPTGAANLSVQTVQDVQRAAGALGFPTIPPSGQLDQPTKRAVATLQRQFGLPQTGLPDLVTMKAIEHALANLTMAGPPVGQFPTVQTATKDTVQRLAQSASQIPLLSTIDLQRALNAVGTKPSLQLDNIVGPKTTAALKAFQISQGLVADGIPGPKTLTALQAAVDPKSMKAVSTASPSIFTGEPVFGGRHKKHKKAA